MLDVLVNYSKRRKHGYVIDELDSEPGLGPTVHVHVVLHDWIRHTDGKLSFPWFCQIVTWSIGPDPCKSRSLTVSMWILT
ncbi:hypothetical protein TorRG33x02_305060 [Trema orientale]|uniref:Uncharacterized protein n=1 Tax=Trema orientale TaxID=63057 RepID=A0A2P5BXK8_TREOI|nr:hypothetical protein TorRG33x02_305060 [Trema orientale]